MTLYKNKNNVLPLDPSKVAGIILLHILYKYYINLIIHSIKSGIAVIGPQAVYPSLLTGNYANYPDKGCFTVMQGLREGLGENTNPQCTFCLLYTSPSPRDRG